MRVWFETFQWVSVFSFQTNFFDKLFGFGICGAFDKLDLSSTLEIIKCCEINWAFQNTLTTPKWSIRKMKLCIRTVWMLPQKSKLLHLKLLRLLSFNSSGKQAASRRQSTRNSIFLLKQSRLKTCYQRGLLRYSNYTKFV